MHTTDYRKAFTIIELMVVMAVITVLAAILLPVAITARNRARTAACLSNLRQLGAAVFMYADDHDGYLPFVNASPFAGSWTSRNYPQGTGSSYVCTTLADYVKNSDILRCPNDRGSAAFRFPLSNRGVFSNAGTSYMWNFARKPGGWLVNGRLIAQTESTSVLFQDYGSDWHGSRVRQGLLVTQETQMNAVYVDGHSASLLAFSRETRKGRYAAAMITPSSDLWVAGTGDNGAAFVYGTIEKPRDDQVATGTRVAMYGTVYSDAGNREVGRVFTFVGSPNNVVVLDQIVIWLESLIQ